MRLDRQLTLGLKAIAQCEETMLALGCTFDVVSFANEQLGDFAAEAFTQEKIMEVVKQQLTVAGKQLIRRVPNLSEATSMWLDQYMAGKLTMHIDTSDLSQHVDSFSVAVRRLTAGLVTAGIIIGTAIVASQLVVFQDANAAWLPLTAVIVFVLMLIVGLVVLWNSLRAPDNSRSNRWQ